MGAGEIGQSETNAAPPMDGGGARERAPRRRSKAAVAARWGIWAITASAVAALIALGAAQAVAFLEQRAANAPTPEPTPPLPVETLAVERVEGYQVIDRYAGRVEPTRAADLAFERAGLVTAVLVEEGDRVLAGQEIARLDADRLEAERARLEAERRRLEADRALAERTTTRQEELAGRGFSSSQSFDEARFRVESLTAQIDGVAAQQRALDIDIEKSVLRAPFAGVVAQRFVDDGAVVGAGARVIEVQESDRPRARIGVPPATAARLKVGEAYLVELDGRRELARLVAVRPDLDPSARTVELLLALDDHTPTETAPHRRPPVMGAVVRLELPRQVATAGFWVPLRALQQGQDGLWSVYTVAPAADGEGFEIGQETVERVHVEGRRAFVTVGTVGHGARVVSAGVSRIVRGQRIEPIDIETMDREPTELGSGDGAAAN